MTNVRIDIKRDIYTADAVSTKGRILRTLRGEPVRCEACTSLFVMDSRGNCAACGSPAPMQEPTRSIAMAVAAATEPVKGFDISKWTTITNATQAIAGYTFAIIRARDGIRDDSSWVTNKALAQKLPFWGPYAFFNPRFTTGEADSAWRQSEAYWELIKNSDGMNIPAVIDCENSPNFTMPSASIYLHELKIYVDNMSQRIGRRPIVYSNLSFFDNYLEAHVDKPNSSFEAEQNKQWLRDCPLWIARPTAATSPGLPKAWSKWAFWQYKLDVTNHPGLSVCDENYWPGTLAQLQAWCNSESAGIPTWGTVTPPPPPPPVDKTLEERVTAAEARLTALEAAPVKAHTHIPGGVA